ncbi:SHOCT domain-containing protein [Paracoccus sp. YIM 132242]|uniref:SHOCT domain-containing protein n=1 Tax=Paracoccus lichenicola TaxID=2665644 RepID=A0A6L6HM29_9RHOB|nr:SHOCT domain-containing protein [Paracoccus lichenicola]MTE00236.1 SHOCT domain-containing protein [Paracoccus lichenicola]
MQLTQEGRDRVARVARQHGFSPDAAETMLAALVRGHGRQAQFDHPEFGGMGQWSGGMLMVGDMFDNGLKARVADLIQDLSGMVGSAAFAQQAQDGGDASDWPSDLGAPSSSGGQNDMRYAVFPASRRLAVMRGGRMVLYDTGDHQISGVSQQQGGGHALTFTSQHGPVPLDSLAPVAVPDAAPAQAAPPKPSDAPQDSVSGEASRPASPEGSIPALIEQLHALMSRSILTQAEFDAKKAELLKRL